MHRARPAYPILQIAGGAKLHSGRFRTSFFLAKTVAGKAPRIVLCRTETQPCVAVRLITPLGPKV